MSDRELSELREELELIRRTASSALERLVRLGAGFGPASDVPRVTEETIMGIRGRIRDGLPQDVLPKLTFLRQVDGVVTITATWLGKGSFDKVTQAVEKMGGRWISAGKASRWEIPVP
ncbi:hypothetical protein ES708_17942 [subsurface metagenome]